VEERRETAGLTMRLIVEYVRRNHGEDAVRRMLAEAGETRPLSVLEDETVWSTYEAKVALFAAAATVTGRPDVARRIGETVLDSSVGSTLKVALGLLGSPGSLLRVIPRASAKFSTAGVMQAESISQTSAVVRYRVRDGFAPSHFDCDYTVGLLTQAPALFGLPPAMAEHDECQVLGAPECVYRLRWRRQSRLPWKRRRQSIPAEALLDRLRQLQETLGDLVASTQVDEVLDAIAARAGSAVSAERFVLAARLDASERVRVRYDGFDVVSAQEVAASLVAGEEPTLTATDHMLVVDVRTALRSYGHLAAFARFPFLAHERELLESYARLAATALDTVTALAAADERRRTAEALLELASNLHRAHDRPAVAAAVADAARTVVEADASGVLLFDDDGTLRVHGHSGFPEDLQAIVSAIAIDTEDTPELDDVLAHPDRPRIYDGTTQDEFVRGMMQLLRLHLVAVLPINGTDRLHGVLIGGWFTGSRSPVVGAALFARLAGLADQATNALEKAHLVDQVRRQATTDALTGLANRRLLGERLRTAIDAADRDAPPALLFVDLDRFKVVNDTLGHGAGDELLVHVAHRLQDSVRTDDLVARLGGDEFTVLLPSVQGPGTALALAERIVDSLAEPVVLDGRTLHVRASVGVLMIGPGTTVSGALRDADAAMYAAKKAGGSRCVLFDPERLRSDTDMLDLESDLYTAVTEEQLHLAFQPQVDLVTGATVGVECLIRWDHPTRGSVVPDRFLPVAEATGLIVPLDLWVLRNACAQGAAWWRHGLELRMAVNVSARTLTDPRFVPSVVEALAAHGLPGRALEIELTEATAIADTDAVCAVLAALRGHGVTVAVDDLGTGYSSLAWVSSFPVDRIKIDRSFVADLDRGGRGEPLVEALIGIARRLGHGVIAEGVETGSQVRRLLELGCTQAQGFVLGRPGSADDVERQASRPGISA
jgi:diguanylate cyclase (GGDEF)-like protein